MTRRLVARWLLACGLLAGPAMADVPPQAPIPALDSAVVDTTATLTPRQREGIEARIAPFEAARGSQMQVLIVSGTHPESIEAYAVRVFAQWKLGRKGVDDGVLIVVAKDQHQARIEVGYGLEGAIPDAAASRILDERMLPPFRAGDYAGGIADGVDALIALAEDEPLPAPAMRAEVHARGIGFGTIVAIVFASLVVGVFLAVPVAGAVYAWRHRRRGFWIRLIALGVLACVALVCAISDHAQFQQKWPPFAILGYLVVTFTFISVFPGGGGGSSDDDSHSAGSSSGSGSGSDSGSERSGGGGSSGGGGASANW